MAISATTLTRTASIAAAAAGLIFIGVQINHPPLDVTTVASTEVVVRDSLKVLMAVLALAGLTGMYLRQVRPAGVLGLIGYVLISAGYLLILGTSFVATFVLPEIAATDPSYVDAVLAVANGRTTDADIGLLRLVFQVQGFAYLAGGLVFGIALFRARVLARWANVLLAVGGLVSAAVTVMPDAFYRLLAFPTGVAMIGLGYSLWRTARTAPTPQSPTPQSPTPQPAVDRAPRPAAAGRA
jgi:hypothetical protein